MKETTPVLIGVGQAVEAVPDDLSAAASHADMAGRAAIAALKDSGVSGTDVDWLACVRTFSDSSPAYACPFGGPDKFPLAIAARLDAAPKQAIYDVLGGQSPQTLVAEAAQALKSGAAKFAVIAGGEALANMRAAQRAGQSLDWSERHDGDWTDRGPFNGPSIMSAPEMAHGLLDPMSYYGFIETARRIKAGRTVEAHRDYMAALLAPMSVAAERNPYAMFRTAYSAKDIATPSPANRNLISPFLKHMVAKDAINQGAAIVMTTIAQAEALGVPRSKWVFLLGHAEAQEKLMLDRTELSGSVAMDLVIDGALEASNIAVAEIDHADIYSCFPCVVDHAATRLNRIGKPMTLTGGLPFFGGPGNNYTLHGICEVVDACRRSPGTIGLAHGNGGWMSKQAVGVYSTDWKDGVVFANKTEIAKQVTAQFSPGQADAPSGKARLESYIVKYKRGAPVGATVIGQLPDGLRFYAGLQAANADVLTALAAGELDAVTLRAEAGAPANKAWVY